MADINIQRGSGFTYRFTLNYNSTGLPINLDDCTAITISLIRDNIDETVLLTRTLAEGSITKITATSGIGEIYVGGGETDGEERGVYKAKATVRITNANFTDGYVDNSGILEDTFNLD